MPDFKNTLKQDILSAIDRQPGVSHFTGWDGYGTPRLITGEGRRSFDTAMQNPAYDEEIERALVRDSAGLGHSALQENTPVALDLPTKHLRYMQEVSNSPSGARASITNSLISALRGFGLNLPNK
jgi:hypothetical protein